MTAVSMCMRLRIDIEVPPIGRDSLQKKTARENVGAVRERCNSPAAEAPRHRRTCLLKHSIQIISVRSKMLQYEFGASELFLRKALEYVDM